MKRFVALCFVAVALATAPAFSADLKKGAVAYDKGDYKTALREWLPLAEEGNAIVQYFLGLMYKHGRGVPQDYKTAAKWYALSAEQGDKDSQYNLGVMYGNGQGVLQDYARAHMWINLAASNGQKIAIESRDSITKLMTPAQIDKAQDLARECLAKDYKGC